MITEQFSTKVEQIRSSHRPLIRATTGMVASGHYLATQAGVRILERGGNAIDAGVAAGICLGILQSDMVNFAGVAPIMIYLANSHEIKTISGLGPWPKAASVQYFKEHFEGKIPVGIHRTVVPAAPDAWIRALKLYGTMSFEEVTRDAISLAEFGFPMYTFMSNNLKAEVNRYKSWPSSAEIYLPKGRPPEPGEVFLQKDLAETIKKMVRAEKKKKFSGRDEALQAARDEFYRGEIAEAIVDFQKKNDGLLQREDLEVFESKVEAPMKAAYRDYEIYSCGPWCQGPVLLQVLNLLEGFDLQALGHNSTEYIHLICEALKIAFSDREKFYGDPAFVDVPMVGLLSKDYSEGRRSLINKDKAWEEMPPPGDPWKWQHGGRQQSKGKGKTGTSISMEPERDEGSWDTSYVCVVDRYGNAFSATPSDVSNTTPITPQTGLAVSSRGSQSWVDENHASSIQGGKRPRLTPNPAMALRKGKLFMPFGTPGGDVQCQAMLQVLLNIIEFHMDPQVAVEVPRFATFSFPNSFSPHEYVKGLLKVEKRIEDKMFSQLKEKGHKMEWWPDWAWKAGAVCAIMLDPVNDVLLGAADPRRESYALGL
jgi:gamma-glutamyltranspeptidase/glutathione hydrolase